MASQNIQIKAQSRKSGKSTSRALRVNKMIPSVAYGPQLESVSFAIHENDVIKYTKRAFDNQIINIVSDEKTLNGLSLLLKKVVKDPRSSRPTHVDFYAPNMDQTVKVNVEIVYEGIAPGVGEGGVFNAIRRELEVECKPNDIPENIVVDISGLEINGSIHVSDISAGSVNITTSGEITVATCSTVAEEKEAPVVEAVAAEGAEGEAAPAADAPAADVEKK